MNPRYICRVHQTELARALKKAGVCPDLAGPLLDEIRDYRAAQAPLKKSAQDIGRRVLYTPENQLGAICSVRSDPTLAFVLYAHSPQSMATKWEDLIPWEDVQI